MTKSVMGSDGQQLHSVFYMRYSICRALYNLVFAIAAH